LFYQHPKTLFTMPPRHEHIRAAGDATARFLSRFLEESAIDTLRLLVQEWISNLIQHADKPPSLIEIFIADIQGQDHLIIQDNGSNFKDFLPKTASVPPPKALPIKEFGRGISLIKHFAPDAMYCAHQHNNFFCIPLKFCQRLTPSNKPLIALIDDSLTTTQLLTTYLKAEYNVITFTSAQAFLDQLNNLLPSLQIIISDIKMPNIDGLTLKRILSKKRQADIIPFIFLTNTDEADTINEAVKLGIDDFLQKTVSKETLLQVLNRILIRKTRERSQLTRIISDEISRDVSAAIPTTIKQYRLALYSKNVSTGGGDFVIHTHIDHHDILVIGDVMGHGVAAKFLSNAYAGYIQGLIKSSNLNAQPAELLAQLSDLIYQDPYLEPSIITLCALLVHDDALIIASAGHPKPILLHNGALDYINVSGTLAGFKPGQRYAEKSVTLHKNDQLLCYTDGLFEVGLTAKEMRHIAKQTLRTLHQHAQDPALFDALVAYTKTLDPLSITDDMTFLLISPKTL
jgi:sigma-B regulation protein RsbU (phosphoserine phosphatase)